MVGLANQLAWIWCWCSGSEPIFPHRKTSDVLSGYWSRIDRITSSGGTEIIYFKIHISLKIFFSHLVNSERAGTLCHWIDLWCFYLTVLLTQKHGPVVTSENILLLRYQCQLEGKALIFGMTKDMNYVNGRERPRKKLIFDISIAELASTSARSVLVHMRAW